LKVDKVMEEKLILVTTDPTMSDVSEPV
jgi:hypothetical protein